MVTTLCRRVVRATRTIAEEARTLPAIDPEEEIALRLHTVEKCPLQSRHGTGVY